MPILIWVILTSTKLALVELIWRYYIIPDLPERVPQLSASLLAKDCCFLPTLPHSSSLLYFPRLSQSILLPHNPLNFISSMKTLFSCLPFQVDNVFSVINPPNFSLQP